MEATIRSGPWRATIARTNAGSRQRAGPDRDPRGPGADRPRDRDRRPQAPAELDARPPVHLGDDLGRGVQLLRLAVPGPVEVDDVEPRRAHG